MPDSAVGGTSLPVQVVSCGLPFVLVPMTTRRAVDNAMIAVQRLDAIIPNTFGDDHEVMTAWDIARQVNKPKHRKKTDKTNGWLLEVGTL